MRRFNPEWFDLYGSWLEYSVKMTKAYCLFCYWLRDYTKNKGGSVAFFVRVVGSVNSFHNNALERADDLIRQGQSIVQDFHKQDDIVKNEYKIRLNASIDCSNRGNFLELVKYTTGQNELVSKVVLENAPKNNQMVCPKIQKDEVTGSIIQEMGVVFRFVDKHGTFKERFIDLIHVKETSSAYMKCAIDSLFTKHGLSMKQLRGQGYDGASNMKGKFNGLRSLIMRENSYAYYIQCFAHQHQLVVVAVPKKHFKVRDFFEIISILVNVVGASGKRKDMLREEYRKDRGRNHLGDLARVMMEARKYLSHPQVDRLLKIALILPIATATVEKCFSAMIIVKTSLCNRISDQFMNNCLFCFI
ncbi:hypothetical protein CARUB_v10015567mg [Capsella rubella]|uniref:TTF-type domain-containing protein n=1 Tax=Capsella rubella TaxID=81985 RepID=R0I2Z5_9BRAS|nr:hypothetical protein CARUB_v10015567mg [Capsella rubella]